MSCPPHEPAQRYSPLPPASPRRRDGAGGHGAGREDLEEAAGATTAPRGPLPSRSNTKLWLPLARRAKCWVNKTINHRWTRRDGPAAAPAASRPVPRRGGFPREAKGRRAAGAAGTRTGAGLVAPSRALGGGSGGTASPGAAGRAAAAVPRAGRRRGPPRPPGSPGAGGTAATTPARGAGKPKSRRRRAPAASPRGPARGQRTRAVPAPWPRSRPGAGVGWRRRGEDWRRRGRLPYLGAERGARVHPLIPAGRRRLRAAAACHLSRRDRDGGGSSRRGGPAPPCRGRAPLAPPRGRARPPQPAPSGRRRGRGRGRGGAGPGAPAGVRGAVPGARPASGTGPSVSSAKQRGQRRAGGAAERPKSWICVVLFGFLLTAGAMACHRLPWTIFWRKQTRGLALRAYSSRILTWIREQFLFLWSVVHRQNGLSSPRPQQPAQAPGTPLPRSPTGRCPWNKGWRLSLKNMEYSLCRKRGSCSDSRFASSPTNCLCSCAWWSWRCGVPGSAEHCPLRPRPPGPTVPASPCSAARAEASSGKPHNSFPGSSGPWTGSPESQTTFRAAATAAPSSMDLNRCSIPM